MLSWANYCNIWAIYCHACATLLLLMKVRILFDLGIPMAMYVGKWYLDILLAAAAI